MSSLTAISVREGEVALEKVPARVEQMQLLLDGKFAYASLKDVERYVCIRVLLYHIYVLSHTSSI